MKIDTQGQIEPIQDRYFSQLTSEERIAFQSDTQVALSEDKLVARSVAILKFTINMMGVVAVWLFFNVLLARRWHPPRLVTVIFVGSLVILCTCALLLASSAVLLWEQTSRVVSVPYSDLMRRLYRLLK